MKIQQSKNEIFMRDSIKSRDGKSKSTISANDLNLPESKIEQKRKEAQKKAMKVVGVAFANEKKIDSDLDARRSKIASLRDEIKDAQREIAEFEEDKNVLKDVYGITEDSQEQKDLELLEKEREARRIHSGVKLTKEEQENLEEIKKQERTEYQKRALEYDDWMEPLKSTVEDAKKKIETEIAIITEVNLEREKYHEMVDATKTAEEINEAASKEIIGMLQEEAKEHVDEVSEEKQNEAEEKKEKEEAEEEQLQAIKEKVETMEEIATGEKKNTKDTQETNGDALTEQIAKLESSKVNIEAEVQTIVDKMNLVIEDIKGAAVDRKA